MLRALNQFAKKLPSLIKMMVTVFLAFAATGGFLGAVLDRFGLRGCPPDTGPLTWQYWLVLTAGLWFFWCVVRSILWPRLIVEEWVPVHSADMAVLVQTRAKMRYAFLTNHPSYVLVDVLAVILPAVIMVMAWNEPCHANRQVLMLRSAVALWCIIPILRLWSWYGLCRGRAQLLAALPEGDAAGKAAALEWRFCWRPVLNLWALYLVIGGLIGSILAWDAYRERRDTPVLDLAMRARIMENPFQLKERRLRVLGTRTGEVIETRGGLRGLGARLSTQAGEVLVFSDALMAETFQGLLQNGGDISLVATAMPEISSEDARNFAWNPALFGDAPAGGWLLLRFVKP